MTDRADEPRSEGGAPLLMLSGGGALAVMAVTLVAMAAGILLAVRVERGLDTAQVVEIRTNGGYAPNEITVDAGRPVTLRFQREDDGACDATVVVETLGIRADLKPHGTTDVTFTPRAAGRLLFHCGMGCLRGTITVREGLGEGPCEPAFIRNALHGAASCDRRVAAT